MNSHRLIFEASKGHGFNGDHQSRGRHRHLWPASGA
jgi:hypothetical protein